MKRRILLLLAALGVLGAASRPAAAGEREDLLKRAEAAYRERRWDDAVAAYEKLAATGLVNEDLDYDLGNAYVLAYRGATDEKVRAGKLGKAILWYERALRVQPDHEDARYNVRVARDLVATKYGTDKVKDAERDPLWIRAVTWLPLRTIGWLFLAFDVLFFGMLIVLRFLPSGFLRTGLVVGQGFTAVAGLLVGTLFGHLRYLSSVRAAVVIPDEIVLRAGPDPAERAMPTLHAGHHLVVVREAEGWVRVRLANRMEGYLPREAVEDLTLFPVPVPAPVPVPGFSLTRL